MLLFIEAQQRRAQQRAAREVETLLGFLSNETLRLYFATDRR